MNTEKYTLRHAVDTHDAQKLKKLFDDVFLPEEDVGTLAATIFHHLPGMKNDNWFIAEEKETTRIVSAFCLIPWAWQMNGIELKVAEMGIVATDPRHRKQGLIWSLFDMFQEKLDTDSCDLAVIQGIPGFYHRLGFYYSIPLENNVRLPLYTVPEQKDAAFSFRKARGNDIPFLQSEERTGHERYFISNLRSSEHWAYLMTHAAETDCASDFWIMQNNKTDERYYFRNQLFGFGTGLNISEISESITADAMIKLLAFCKELALHRDKPYIRLTLSEASHAAQTAKALGCEYEPGYAWQIRIVNPAALLSKMTPVFEQRIIGTPFDSFTGTFALDNYRQPVTLCFTKGKISRVSNTAVKADLSLSLPDDLMPALVLGHRNRGELRRDRPDVSTSDTMAALLADYLFPRENSWVNCQY